MKKLLTLSLLIGGLAPAFAQGTLQFTASINGHNEVLPNNSMLAGSGSFTLTGNSLDFLILIQPAFSPTSAGIYGPAAPGVNGPFIVDLGTPGIVAPYPGPPPDPGHVGYSGSFTLTPQQLSDLENGLWYVNVLTSAYPGGEIRGQIVPVPEPSTWALMVVAGGLIGYLKGKKRTG